MYVIPMPSVPTLSVHILAAVTMDTLVMALFVAMLTNVWKNQISAEQMLNAQIMLVAIRAHVTPAIKCQMGHVSILTNVSSLTTVASDPNVAILLDHTNAPVLPDLVRTAINVVTTTSAITAHINVTLQRYVPILLARTTVDVKRAGMETDSNAPTFMKPRWLSLNVPTKLMHRKSTDSTSVFAKVVTQELDKYATMTTNASSKPMHVLPMVSVLIPTVTIHAAVSLVILATVSIVLTSMNVKETTDALQMLIALTSTAHISAVATKASMVMALFVLMLTNVRLEHIHAPMPRNVSIQKAATSASVTLGIPEAATIAAMMTSVSWEQITVVSMVNVSIFLAHLLVNADLVMLVMAWIVPMLMSVLTAVMTVMPMQVAQIQLAASIVHATTDTMVMVKCV